jgi:hypothetical protein
MKRFDPSQSSKRWLVYVISAAILSWLLLWGLVHLPVTDSTLVLFFILLFVATVCTTMPPFAYLNARFGQCRTERAFQARFVRQSTWLGTLVVVLAWFQTRRILTGMLAMILTAVFALIETFLLTREHPARST